MLIFIFIIFTPILSHKHRLILIFTC